MKIVELIQRLKLRRNKVSKKTRSRINPENGQGTISYDNGEEYRGEVKDGKPDGNGVLTLGDKVIYNGEWKNGKMHGKGTLSLEDGLIYEGDFVEGKQCGQGTLTLGDKVIYNGKWKNGQKHGEGTIIYSNGDKYEGEWENGLQNGQGTFTSAKGDSSNGNKYQGGWVGGKRSGTGILAYFTLTIYEGDWRNDVQHGKGIYYYENAESYDGDWVDGKRHGIGTFIGEYQDIYKGFWEDDKRHGIGTFVDKDGSVYEGFWKDDKKHGIFSKIGKDGEIEKIMVFDNDNCIEQLELQDNLNGKLNNYVNHVFQDGDRYIGKWRNNVPNGQGVCFYANGSKYIGEWKDDVPNGQGVYISQKGDKYIGECREGKMYGQGVYFYANRDKYEGEWRDGSKNGQGTITYANGDKYEGEWENGLQNGQGTITYANGDKYEGKWENGLPNGQGTFTDANGDIYKGSWVNGQRHGMFRKTNDSNKTEEIIEFCNEIYIARPEICQKSIFNIGANGTMPENYGKLLKSLNSIELVKEKNINIGFLDLDNGKVPSFSPEKNKISLFFLDVPRHALLLQIDIRNFPIKISLINNCEVDATSRESFLEKYGLTKFVENLEKQFDCAVNIEHNSFLNKEDFNQYDGSCALDAMLNILDKIDLEFAPKETNLTSLPNPFSREDQYFLNNIINILIDNNMAEITTQMSKKGDLKKDAAGITTQMSKEGDMLYNLSLFGGDGEDRVEYPLGVLFSEKIVKKSWEAEDAIPSSRVVLLNEIQDMHCKKEFGKGGSLESLDLAMRERNPDFKALLTKRQFNTKQEEENNKSKKWQRLNENPDNLLR